jgi:hypothetical protein
MGWIFVRGDHYDFEHVRNQLELLTLKNENSRQVVRKRQERNVR